jgi:hypothetical protein
MTWAVMTGWRFEAVEVERETDKMVFFIEAWRNKETRREKKNFLDWRGDEETARMLVDKLTSAEAEYNRRRAAASDWYKARRAAILASADAQGEAS